MCGAVWAGGRRGRAPRPLLSSRRPPPPPVPHPGLAGARRAGPPPRGADSGLTAAFLSHRRGGAGAAGPAALGRFRFPRRAAHMAGLPRAPLRLRRSRLAGASGSSLTALEGTTGAGTGAKVAGACAWRRGRDGGHGRGRASAHAPRRPARPRSVGVVGGGWLWSKPWLPKAQLAREEQLHRFSSSRDVSQVC